MKAYKSVVLSLSLLLLCMQLNLACQSVLEGLNACFDHRSEVFIPELAMTFKVQHKLTRFFACQNPVSEGGGRKSLPRSFLNRFTQVYMGALTTSDLLFITKSSYPQIPTELLERMVEFNQQVVFIKYITPEVFNHWYVTKTPPDIVNININIKYKCNLVLLVIVLIVLLLRHLSVAVVQHIQRVRVIN